MHRISTRVIRKGQYKSSQEETLGTNMHVEHTHTHTLYHLPGEGGLSPLFLGFIAAADTGEGDVWCCMLELFPPAAFPVTLTGCCEVLAVPVASFWPGLTTL